jgi:hypothetical protein
MSTDSIQRWQYIADRSGVSTEAVTNANKALTRQFDQMRNGTGRGAKALENLGIEFSELERLSPDQRMDLLTKKLGGIEDPTERAEMATHLFKGAGEDMIPIIANGAEVLDELGKEADETGTIMSEEALKDADEFRQGIDKLTKQFEGMGRELVSQFLPMIQEYLIPTIQKIIDFVRGWMERFTELDERTKKIIVVVGLVIAAIAPFLLILGTLASAIGTIITVAGTVATVIGAISLPVVAVVAVIAGLIAIGVLLYRNWDQIMDRARSLKDNIKMHFFRIRDDVTQAIESARDAVKRAIDAIIGFFAGIGEKATINIPRPKLPRFTWTGELSIAPPRLPRLNIDWFETGGIFGGPSVIGVGENGREAVINLDKERYFMPFAKAIASNMTNTTGAGDITINIPVELNGRTIARVIAPLIDTELERQRRTKERGV